MSDLRERVARAMWMADVEPYDPADRIPFEEAAEIARAYCLAEADAAIALVLEEAATECERMEGVFAPQQVITGRCAAAIRAMKGKPNPGSGS